MRWTNIEWKREDAFTISVQPLIATSSNWCSKQANQNSALHQRHSSFFRFSSSRYDTMPVVRGIIKPPWATNTLHRQFSNTVLTGDTQCQTTSLITPSSTNVH